MHKKKRNQNESRSRSKARAQALRMLYLKEQRDEDFNELIDDGLVYFENEFESDCRCLHLSSCHPRAYYERFGEAPLDYHCSNRELTPGMQKTACPSAKICSCKRFYDDHQICPEPGYPFKDMEPGSDPCVCKYYKACAYRSFFDASSSRPSEYALKLIEGVNERLEHLDVVLSEVSTNWSVYRMPMIDRNVLRMATFEILYVDDVPTSVVVDEAVNLAKEYGGEDSSKFVNGILGKIAANCNAYRS